MEIKQSTRFYSAVLSNYILFFINFEKLAVRYKKKKTDFFLQKDVFQIIGADFTEVEYPIMYISTTNF